jgi:hypothetical protein
MLGEVTDPPCIRAFIWIFLGSTAAETAALKMNGRAAAHIPGALYGFEGREGIRRHPIGICTTTLPPTNT